MISVGLPTCPAALVAPCGTGVPSIACNSEPDDDDSKRTKRHRLTRRSRCGGTGCAGRSAGASGGREEIAARWRRSGRRIADLKDRLLRAHAEMDNIRKRSEREKAETHKYAVTKFAQDVMTVGDNVQRAIEAVPPGPPSRTPALKSFLEGVTVTERELVNVLERHGIRRMDAARRGLQSASPSGGDGNHMTTRFRRHRGAGAASRLHDRGSGRCGRPWSPLPRAVQSRAAADRSSAAESQNAADDDPAGKRTSGDCAPPRDATP